MLEYAVNILTVYMNDVTLDNAFKESLKISKG
jgi:hypothetical protein